MNCGVVTGGQRSLATAKGFLLLFTVNKQTNQPTNLQFSTFLDQSPEESVHLVRRQLEEIAHRSLRVILGSEDGVPAGRCGKSVQPEVTIKPAHRAPSL